MSKLQFAPVVALSVLAFSVSTPAAAQTTPTVGAAGGSSCPPGSWFCAQAPQQQAAPAGQPVGSLEPLPDPETAPAPPVKHHAKGAAVAEPSEPPPPVIYEPPPVGEVDRTETPPPYEYAPRPTRPISPPHEWGLNLHMEGAAIGHGAQGNSGMGGFGAGIRFKPSRNFGVEGDLDFVGGHDYNGDNRNETAFTLNGLVFLNPKSQVQVYLLGGFGWSSAHVTNDQGLDAGYGYFGAQGGLGLEFRLTRVLAFNADFRAFIRGRTDNGADLQPEFVDAYGHSTNTSGGGLFTGGMTLYF